MIGARIAVAIVLVWLVGASGSVSAGPLVVVDAHAEIDVADEASAVTLLVRHALTRPERPLLATAATMAGPPWTTRNAASRANALAADAVVLIDVARDGTGLIAIVLVVTPDGKVAATTARAGDGNISGLAEGVVRHIGNVTGARSSAVPSASLGELRPFAAAERTLRSTTDATAIAAATTILRGADPLIALRVVSIAERLRPILLPPGDDVAAAPRLTAEQRLLMMRLLSTPSELALAASTTNGPLSRAAEAFVDGPTDKLRALDGALQSAGRDPIVKFARAVIAHRRNDNALRDKLILELLVGDLRSVAMAWTATLPARGLPAQVHKALLVAAEQIAPTAPGLASKIALAAVEAGVEKNRAMAVLSIPELNDAEIGRLEPLLPGVDERILMRLNAELAIRRNDDSQIAAIEALTSFAPGEARGHLYHGRQLMSDKLFREAANEFAKSGSVLEHARALALAGDLKEALTLANSIGAQDTAEFLTVQANVALAGGDVTAARAAIDRAEATAPASAQVNRTIVSVSAKAPQEPSQTAAIATISAVADAVAPTIKVSSIGNGNNSNPTVNSVAGAQDASAQSKLASEVAPLLESLNSLGTLPAKDLVLAELAWKSPFYSLRSVKPEIIRAALTEALARAPLGLRVVASVPKPQHEPIERTALRQVTGSHAAVLFYQVQNDGSQVRLRLLLFPQGSTEGTTASRTVNGYGAVTWNQSKVVAIAVAIFLLLGWVLLLIIRGSGDLDVRYKLDADSKDEVFGIVIAKTDTRPAIADLKKFYQDTPKAGQKIEQRRAILIGGQTKFRLPPGQWTVVLYGVFDRADALVEVPASMVKTVSVRRGKTEFVAFDLIPKDAELRINIHGNQKRGIGVWLNDNREKKVYTDAQGNVSLHCNVGTHVLYAEVEGRVFDRKLQIAALRIERVSLNLERELKLAAVTGFATPEQQAANTPPPGTAANAPSNVAPPVPAASSAMDMGDLDLSEFTGPAITPKPAAQTGVRIADLMNANAPANATAFIADTSGKVAAPGFFEPAGPAKPKPLAKPLLPPAATVPAAAPERPSAPNNLAAPAKATSDLLMGRYALRQELGRGAMGVVYRAYDTNLERDVAIKSLARELRSHPDALRMFQQEAKALAQMNHGNIVSVFDQVTEADETYLIMEFVDGRTLDDILQERKIFPWLEAAAMIDNICAGLAYAHARAVIHRDIKPANIFVGKDRSVKLGDFGLARVVREMSIRQTEIRGTPLYMAPEQITGRDIDARADLYAVGCTFFELVCGRPPFIDGEILYAQLNEKPPNPCDLNPDIEPAVGVLILQMIAKAAADRPASADAVRAQLRKITSAALL